MNTTFRKLKEYHPRRKSKDLKLKKAKLASLEKEIKDGIEELLLFVKQGLEPQTRESSQKVRSLLLNLGSEIQKTAIEVGPPFPKMVYSFLHSAGKILDAENTSPHSPFYKWIDESKIVSFEQALQKLEKKLTQI